MAGISLEDPAQVAGINRSYQSWSANKHLNESCGFTRYGEKPKSIGISTNVQRGLKRWIIQIDLRFNYCL